MFEPKYLKNWQSVVTAFGYWPSFHDSHVLAFSRTDSGPLGQIDLELHGGYSKLIKHHRVAFRFLLTDGEDVQPRPDGNIVLDLEFSSYGEYLDRRFFTVRLHSALDGDLSAEFRARHGEVVSVVPCDDCGTIRAKV